MSLSEVFQTEHKECIVDQNGDSCRLTSSQLGVLDAIAGIRMIAASLSFIGALSIILLSIAKKLVLSSKVHPIFILSVADLLLSLLWIAGGGAWQRRVGDRVWCYAISLPTIIIECTTVNLTLVYAFLAYSGIKKQDFNSLLRNAKNGVSVQVWHPAVTAAAYITAWVLPMVIVMIQFGALAGQTHLVTHANNCSCWCLPVYGNVLPLAQLTEQTSNGTRQFVHDVNVLIATYGFVLGTHYLVGFILLVVIYTKLLRYIKRIRKEYEQTHSSDRQYGATGMMLVTGQSKAKRRVMAFLTVFVMTGILNFLLSYMYMIAEAIVLTKGPSEFHLSQGVIVSFNIILGLQSFLVPLQGFLNAIVYGWTREDFAKLLAIGNDRNDGNSLDAYEESDINHSVHENDIQTHYDLNIDRNVAEENSFVEETSEMYHR